MEGKGVPISAWGIIGFLQDPGKDVCTSEERAAANLATVQVPVLEAG